MALEFKEFRIEHLRFLVPQPAQRQEHALLVTTSYGDILDRNPGLAAWQGSVCVAAAGWVPIYPHRVCCWALFSEAASPFMLPIARKMRNMIRILPYRRVEIVVRADFVQGHQLARLIGMTLETPEPLKGHGVDGADEVMYAVVK